MEFVLRVMHSQIYLESQSWPLSKRKEVVVVSNSVDFLLRSYQIENRIATKYRVFSDPHRANIVFHPMGVLIL